MSTIYGNDERVSESTTTTTTNTTVTNINARTVTKYNLQVGLRKNVTIRPRFFGFSYDFVDIPFDNDSKIVFRGMTAAGNVDYSGFIVELILDVHLLSDGTHTDYVLETISLDTLTHVKFTTNAQYFRIEREYKLSDVIPNFIESDIAQIVPSFKQTTDLKDSNVVFSVLVDGPPL